MEFPIRINKYLAEKGYSTRTGADELISAGKVKINGKKAVLGMKVMEKDIVIVDGTSKKAYVYYAYNKPAGIITNAPQKGEVDIIHYTRFPHKVFPIGRLDKDSDGLIIMTNDGRITDRLLNPEKVHEKEYTVTVDKPITPEFETKMKKGVKIISQGEKYTTKPAKVKILSTKKFSIVLTEGKKRQIRRMCEALGQQVQTLTRVRIMNILLGSLKPGAYLEITDRNLSDFLKLLKL